VKIDQVSDASVTSRSASLSRYRISIWNITIKAPATTHNSTLHPRLHLPYQPLAGPSTALPRFAALQVQRMIGRPTEGRGHVFNVDLGNYDDLTPTLHFTLLQLLSLVSVLLLLLLIYGLRSLRLKLSSLGRLCDKEALGTKSSTKEVERVGFLKDEKRSWWWIEAVVGTDEEERPQLDGHATATSHTYADGAKLARWSFQNAQQSLVRAQQTMSQGQPMPTLRQQPPPLSMAKLIMSRHAYPPRRPRLPPAHSNHHNSQNLSQHASRPPSRLSSHVEVRQ